MFVRLKVCYSSATRQAAVGDVIEVDEDEGLKLIKGKFAEPAEGPTETVQPGEVPEPEGAMSNG